jgi:hypothetical protein
LSKLQGDYGNPVPEPADASVNFNARRGHFLLALNPLEIGAINAPPTTQDL